MLAGIKAHGRDLTGIMVGSVEQFQGEEKRVIIVSTVRATEESVYKQPNAMSPGTRHAVPP